MNAYAIARFLHVMGAAGFFVALGLEWTGLRQIRRAGTSELVRGWMGILANARQVGFASMLTAVITGIYMMRTAWGGVAWLYVTVAALILLIVLTVAISGPRIAAIGRALTTEKAPGSPTFNRLASHPLLWMSIQTRLALAMGIIFLKSAKPDLGGSLIALGVAIVLGLASTLPISRQAKAAVGLTG